MRLNVHLHLYLDMYLHLYTSTSTCTCTCTSHQAETELCGQLGAAMAAAKGDKARELEVWDENWQTVYALAEATMARTMSEFMA